MVRTRGALWALALAIFLLFPVVVTNPAYRNIAVVTLIFMACATSWNMFSGYSGYVALGSAAFYGTGAYTMALLRIIRTRPAARRCSCPSPWGGAPRGRGRLRWARYRDLRGHPLGTRSSVSIRPSVARNS